MSGTGLYDLPSRGERDRIGSENKRRRSWVRGERTLRENGFARRKRSVPDVRSASVRTTTPQSNTIVMRNSSLRTAAVHREQSPRRSARRFRGGRSRCWSILSRFGLFDRSSTTWDANRGPNRGSKMRSLDEYGWFSSNAGLGMDDNRLGGSLGDASDAGASPATGVAAGTTTQFGKVEIVSPMSENGRA